MRKNEITKEQLAKMSDLDIDSALLKLLCKITGLNLIPKSYCHDWSATGPLMVEYRIGVGENGMAYRHFNDGIPSIYSENKNPLRAICEVILMIGGKP